MEVFALAAVWLLRFFLLRAIAFFADFLFLGGLRATGMSAVLAFGDGLVAAGGFLLAFLARLAVLAGLDTTRMLAVFAFGFGFNAATLVRQRRAGAQADRHDGGNQNRQQFDGFHDFFVHRQPAITGLAAKTFGDRSIPPSPRQLSQAATWNQMIIIHINSPHKFF